MAQSPYKFLDADKQVVVRVSDNRRFYPRDNAEFIAWRDAGNTPDPADPPTEAELLASYTAAIQNRLDDFARTRGYDGILSATTYAGSGVPKFNAEGGYALSARDATWAKGYDILAAVQAGTRPAPTLAELDAELPALVWPV